MNVLSGLSVFSLPSFLFKNYSDFFINLYEFFSGYVNDVIVMYHKPTLSSRKKISVPGSSSIFS